jgi:hypothetical protein
MAESVEDEKEKSIQMKNLHESLQLGAVSDVFPDEIYTVENFIWAANVIDTFSITFYQNGEARSGVVPI